MTNTFGCVREHCVLLGDMMRTTSRLKDAVKPWPACLVVFFKRPNYARSLVWWHVNNNVPGQLGLAGEEYEASILR